MWELSPDSYRRDEWYFADRNNKKTTDCIRIFNEASANRHLITSKNRINGNKNRIMRELDAHNNDPDSRAPHMSGGRGSTMREGGLRMPSPGGTAINGSGGRGSAVREGTSANREGTNTTREGTSTVKKGSSTVRDGSLWMPSPDLDFMALNASGGRGCINKEGTISNSSSSSSSIPPVNSNGKGNSRIAPFIGSSSSSSSNISSNDSSNTNDDVSKDNDRIIDDVKKGSSSAHRHGKSHSSDSSDRPKAPHRGLDPSDRPKAPHRGPDAPKGDETALQKLNSISKMKREEEKRKEEAEDESRRERERAMEGGQGDVPFSVYEGYTSPSLQGKGFF